MEATETKFNGKDQRGEYLGERRRYDIFDNKNWVPEGRGVMIG